MREWNLTESDPTHLTIAADSRLTTPEYLNDLIWELKFRGGDPPAVLIESSLGLRVRSLRLFPRFLRNNIWTSDPELFFQKPILHQFTPNYLRLSFHPYQTLAVNMECWVQQSNTLIGKIHFRNTGLMKETTGFEWVAGLTPIHKNAVFTAVEQGVHTILTAEIENLFPVCFMTGGPYAGSHTHASLGIDLPLEKDATRTLTWVLAVTPDRVASYELARATAGENQDGQVARIALLDQSQTVTIHTGNPDLDAGLAFSQKAAFDLLMRHQNQYSLILRRRPEDGSALTDNGRDYGHSWSGSTALDLWYLSQVIGSASAPVVSALLDSFLALQDPTGFIPWRSALNGRFTNRLTLPQLASIAWRVYERTGDQAWLAARLPQLISYLRNWFDQSNDRDGDGYPVWQHPFQSGFDNSNLTHPWNTTSQRVAPETVEAPSLASFLISELDAIARIAEEVRQPMSELPVQELKTRLVSQLAAVWSDEKATYQYRDADTDRTTSGQHLMTFDQSGVLDLNAHFSQPVRLQITCSASNELTRVIRISIRGENNAGPCVEDVTPRKIHWLHGEGHYTTEHTFSTIHQITVEGLAPGDKCTVAVIDHTVEDLSLLLPLITSAMPEAQTEPLIRNTLLKQYRTAFGLSAFPKSDKTSGLVADHLNFPYNLLLLNALYDHGYVQEAADLFLDWSVAIINNLRLEHDFTTAIDSVTGKSTSDFTNCLGLLPVDFFLRLAGIDLLSPNKLVLRRLNTFPFAVNVQFRGIRIHCTADETILSLAGGKQFHYRGETTNTYLLTN